MRVWIALSLIAVTVGCSGNGEASPPVSAPEANSGSHGEMQMPAASPRLIQAHARVVDAFMANGMDEVHREPPVPSKDVAPEVTP